MKVLFQQRWYLIAGIVLFHNAQCAFTYEQYDEALELYQQALEINRIRGEYDDEIAVIDGMATVYTRQQRYDEALDVLQRLLLRYSPQVLTATHLLRLLG